MEKENMKKLLTIVIGLVLTLTLLSGVGTAASLSANGQSGQTDVTFSINDGYQITIPDLIQLQQDAGTAHGLNTIAGQITRLAPNTYLNVTISADEPYYNSTDEVWFMVHGNDNESKIPFYVNSGNHVDDDAPESPIKSGDVVFSLNNIDTPLKLSGSTEIHCKVMNIASITDSGAYTGKLTFTISVNTLPSTP